MWEMPRRAMPQCRARDQDAASKPAEEELMEHLQREHQSAQGATIATAATATAMDIFQAPAPQQECPSHTRPRPVDCVRVSVEGAGAECVAH